MKAFSKRTFSFLTQEEFKQHKAFCWVSPVAYLHFPAYLCQVHSFATIKVEGNNNIHTWASPGLISLCDQPQGTELCR